MVCPYAIMIIIFGKDTRLCVFALIVSVYSTNELNPNETICFIGIFYSNALVRRRFFYLNLVLCVSLSVNVTKKAKTATATRYPAIAFELCVTDINHTATIGAVPPNIA